MRGTKSNFRNDLELENFREISALQIDSFFCLPSSSTIVSASIIVSFLQTIRKSIIYVQFKAMHVSFHDISSISYEENVNMQIKRLFRDSF